MKYPDYDTEELASYFNEYHKDVHGVRPRGIDLTNRGALIDGLERLDRYMLKMKKTPEGRARLREEGWVLPEDD